MSHSPTTTSTVQRSRVLVVDDEKAIRDLFVRLLGRRQVDVVTCATYAEARVALRDELPYALIILDLRLPDGDGLDLAQRAAKLQPEASTLLISGTLDLELAQKAIVHHGVDFALAKPCRAIDLEAIFDRTLTPRPLANMDQALDLFSRVAKELNSSK